MHRENELYENTVDNNAISYKINDLRKKSSEINNSFIKKIFFFEIASEYNCCKNSCFTNCILYFSSNDYKSKSLQNQNINIDTILSSIIIDFICNNCGNKTKSKLKFKSLPEILIIICPTDSDYNSKYLYKEIISLKKYSIIKKNCEYELICTIIKNGQNQKYETYCKSSKEKETWYRYEEIDENDNVKKNNCQLLYKTNFFRNKINNPPYLLIYKNISNKK